MSEKEERELQTNTSNEIKSLEVSVKNLDKRFDNLSKYLSQNGEIVIDLVMRTAALERLLIDKGLFSEQEIQEEVQKTYSKLADKARDNLGVQNGN